jgi:hypothetical protein
MALKPLWTWATFQFLNPYTVGRTPWTGDYPVARPLPTHRTTQTQNKRTHAMPRVGFEPTIPAFEQAKTIHALDRAATAIGITVDYSKQISTDLQVQPIPKLQIRCAGCN